MAAMTFESVWFLPKENKWSDKNPLAYTDKGSLVVGDNSIEFRGTKSAIVITNIRRVSYGKQGRDFVNNWVKVEYGAGIDPSTAFFADGSLAGWGGIFGGTRKILNCVKIVRSSNSENS